jgi:hypothetical protein
MPSKWAGLSDNTNTTYNLAKMFAIAIVRLECKTPQQELCRTVCSELQKWPFAPIRISEHRAAERVSQSCGSACMCVQVQRLTCLWHARCRAPFQAEDELQLQQCGWICHVAKVPTIVTLRLQVPSIETSWQLPFTTQWPGLCNML